MRMAVNMRVTESQWTQYFVVVEAVVTKMRKTKKARKLRRRAAAMMVGFRPKGQGDSQCGE